MFSKQKLRIFFSFLTFLPCYGRISYSGLESSNLCLDAILRKLAGLLQGPVIEEVKDIINFNLELYFLVFCALLCLLVFLKKEAWLQKSIIRLVTVHGRLVDKILKISLFKDYSLTSEFRTMCPLLSNHLFFIL